MKFISILMLSSLICFSAQALEGKLVSLTLEEGARVLPAKDVKVIMMGRENQIDLIELKNGEIFYDTEIKKAEILLFNSSRSINLPLSDVRLLDKAIGAMRVGGDGSGGG